MLKYIFLTKHQQELDMNVVVLQTLKFFLISCFSKTTVVCTLDRIFPGCKKQGSELEKSLNVHDTY